MKELCLACKTLTVTFFLQKAVTECIIVTTQASRPEQFTVYDMFTILLNEVTNVLDINLNENRIRHVYVIHDSNYESWCHNRHFSVCHL